MYKHRPHFGTTIPRQTRRDEEDFEEALSVHSEDDPMECSRAIDDVLLDRTHRLTPIPDGKRSTLTVQSDNSLTIDDLVGRSPTPDLNEFCKMNFGNISPPGTVTPLEDELDEDMIERLIQPDPPAPSQGQQGGVFDSPSLMNVGEVDSEQLAIIEREQRREMEEIEKKQRLYQYRLEAEEKLKALETQHRIAQEKRHLELLQMMQLEEQKQRQKALLKAQQEERLMEKEMREFERDEEEIEIEMEVERMALFKEEQKQDAKLDDELERSYQKYEAHKAARDYQEQKLALNKRVTKQLQINRQKELQQRRQEEQHRLLMEEKEQIQEHEQFQATHQRLRQRLDQIDRDRITHAEQQDRIDQREYDDIAEQQQRQKQLIRQHKANVFLDQEQQQQILRQEHSIMRQQQTQGQLILKHQQERRLHQQLQEKIKEREENCRLLQYYQPQSESSCNPRQLHEGETDEELKERKRKQRMKKRRRQREKEEAAAAALVSQKDGITFDTIPYPMAENNPSSQFTLDETTDQHQTANQAMPCNQASALTDEERKERRRRRKEKKKKEEEAAAIISQKDGSTFETIPYPVVDNNPSIETTSNQITDHYQGATLDQAMPYNQTHTISDEERKERRRRRKEKKQKEEEAAALISQKDDSTFETIPYPVADNNPSFETTSNQITDHYHEAMLDQVMPCNQASALTDEERKERRRRQMEKKQRQKEREEAAAAALVSEKNDITIETIPYPMADSNSSYQTISHNQEISYDQNMSCNKTSTLTDEERKERRRRRMEKKQRQKKSEEAAAALISQNDGITCAPYPVADNRPPSHITSNQTINHQQTAISDPTMPCNQSSPSTKTAASHQIAIVPSKPQNPPNTPVVKGFLGPSTLDSKSKPLSFRWRKLVTSQSERKPMKATPVAAKKDEEVHFQFDDITSALAPSDEAVDSAPVKPAPGDIIDDVAAEVKSYINHSSTDGGRSHKYLPVDDNIKPKPKPDIRNVLGKYCVNKSYVFTSDGKIYVPTPPKKIDLDMTALTTTAPPAGKFGRIIHTSINSTADSEFKPSYDNAPIQPAPPKGPRPQMAKPRPPSSKPHPMQRDEPAPWKPRRNQFPEIKETGILRSQTDCSTSASTDHADQSAPHPPTVKRSQNSRGYRPRLARQGMRVNPGGRVPETKGRRH